MDISTEEIKRNNIMTILCSEANNLEAFIGKLHNLKPEHLKIFFLYIN